MIYFLSAALLGTMVYAGREYHKIWKERPRHTATKVRTHGDRG